MEDLNLDERKNDLLGELDYLNSFIGLAKSFITESRTKKMLTDIQNDIFIIQANVASPTNVRYLPENIGRQRIIDIQKETFYIEKGLRNINHFIIPEGTTAASAVNCVRTIARKVERKIVGYLKQPSTLSMYLDQVACLMFALSRQINQKQGIQEKAPSYFVSRNLKSNKGDRHGQKRNGSKESAKMRAKNGRGQKAGRSKERRRISSPRSRTPRNRKK